MIYTSTNSHGSKAALTTLKPWSGTNTITEDHQKHTMPDTKHPPSTSKQVGTRSIPSGCGVHAIARSEPQPTTSVKEN